jgi:hypothetical protein
LRCDTRENVRSSPWYAHHTRGLSRTKTHHNPQVKDSSRERLRTRADPQNRGSPLVSKLHGSLSTGRCVGELRQVTKRPKTFFQGNLQCGRHTQAKGFGVEGTFGQKRREGWTKQVLESADVVPRTSGVK